MFQGASHLCQFYLGGLHNLLLANKQQHLCGLDEAASYSRNGISSGSAGSPTPAAHWLQPHALYPPIVFITHSLTPPSVISLFNLPLCQLHA